MSKLVRSIFFSLFIVLCMLSVTVSAVSAHTTQLAHPVTHAHVTMPAAVTCFNDACDGWRLHDTDGGSNCKNNNIKLGGTPMTNHSGRNIGYMEFWHSVTCNTFYYTIDMFYTTNEVYHPQIFNTRYSVPSGDDDNKTLSYQYTGWMSQGYHDGVMLGHDFSNTNSECYRGEVTWFDYSGSLIDTTADDGCWTS